LPARSFARADIKKSLDPKKIGRREFLQTEITNNPEFFKAYPNYQSIFALNEETNEVDMNKPYNHEIRTSFNELNTKETEFFNSLL